MRKIVFVLSRMNVGGTERSLLNLIDTLSPDDFEITVLLKEKTGEFLKEIPNHVNVLGIEAYDQLENEISISPKSLVLQRLKKRDILKAFAILFHHILFRITKDRTRYYEYVLRKVKVNGEYDVAVAYEGPEDFTSTFVIECINAKKKIQWIHFDVNKYMFHVQTAKRLYPMFDKVYVVSEEARRALIKRVPQISTIVETKYNVVSEKKCKELAEIGIGYSDGFTGIRILTVGRLSEEKGQDIIPEIVKKLKERDLAFRWYLIGDGELRERIEQSIYREGLGSNLILLGKQINPYPFYKDANIYVQTSMHEGFCITLAEAKMFNIYVLATDCFGAHEQLDNYEKGIIVTRQVKTIYNEIINIISSLGLERIDN